MEYFLPIAQVDINIAYIFVLSLVVGVLSGLFGVGGGFLMTPFLSLDVWPTPERLLMPCTTYLWVRHCHESPVYPVNFEAK